MRFRKFAGIAAGALTAGLLTVPAMSGTAQAATAIPGATFNCDVPAFGAKMDYTTDISVTVKRSAGNTVDIVAEMGDMPGIVPVPIASMDLEAKLSVTVDGAATTLKGSHTATGMASNAPIALPALSGSGVAAGTTAAIAVTRLEVDAEAMGIPVAVVCTPVAPIAGTVPVEGTAKPVPVAKAAKTKSVTKVKLAKNGKKATVTTTVKAGKKNASGKVTITVKKGKKVVAKKTVSLKKGKAKLVVKKGSLKAKGKYVVSAQFKGSKNFKKSNAKKASFKVKK